MRKGLVLTLMAAGILGVIGFGKTFYKHATELEEAKKAIAPFHQLRERVSKFEECPLTKLVAEDPNLPRNFSDIVGLYEQLDDRLEEMKNDPKMTAIRNTYSRNPAYLTVDIMGTIVSTSAVGFGVYQVMKNKKD